ncbi:MAG: hypothetical protein MJY71_01470 [Bacteroidaceae bacterium]|nr:hypothetical protein [Bacteroidaceae bacterium]
MFQGCISLTTAPALPAKTLAFGCYFRMFADCSSLSSITMLATDITANDCLFGRVDGVKSTGIFTKSADMNTLPSRANGIPTGWTILDYVEDN